MFSSKILYEFHIPSMRSICPTHFILSDLIVLIMFREERKWYSCSMHSFFHLLVTYFLLGSNIQFWTPQSAFFPYIASSPCTPIQKNKRGNSVLCFRTYVYGYHNHSGVLGSIPDHSMVDKLVVDRLFSECFGSPRQYHSTTAPHTFIYINDDS
jgi:hypothetical protein